MDPYHMDPFIAKDMAKNRKVFLKRVPCDGAYQYTED